MPYPLCPLCWNPLWRAPLTTIKHHGCVTLAHIGTHVCVSVWYAAWMDRLRTLLYCNITGPRWYNLCAVQWIGPIDADGQFPWLVLYSSCIVGYNTICSCLVKRMLHLLWTVPLYLMIHKIWFVSIKFQNCLRSIGSSNLRLLLESTSINYCTVVTLVIHVAVCKIQ